jgi:ketosteroid isomerase-like protein
MNKKAILIVLIVAVVVGTAGLFINSKLEQRKEAVIIQMVQNHAQAWETGDENLLASLLHKDVVFAYPGRRLNKDQTLEDLRFFRDAYTDTKVYIHTIVIDGDNVAVEWQFATTKKETSKREVVSDAIIGKVKDGQFVVWKEYLDGRVKGLQADGALPLEEGEEPFPWPRKPKRD